MTADVGPGAARAESLGRLTAIDLLEGYRTGRFTPVDAVEDAIGALEVAHRHCNIVATPMFDGARREARAAAAAWRDGRPPGVLAGVPVTVKDLIFVAGVPAMGGAPTARGFVPPVDAVVVQRLRAAGAIVTCKTTTCESGYKLTADSPVTGVTRNPWRLSRTSGGSSGGAAAGVAAGCGPLALGTDGVGSIRVPSSFCGVVGLKPTFGLVPRAPGFFPPSWASLAHTGPIARTAADIALLLGVVSGYDAGDAASLPLPASRCELAAGALDGLRVGFTADFGFAAVSPEVRRAFAAALDVFSNLGARLVAQDVGVDPDVLERTLRPIAYTEQAGAISGRSGDELALSDADYVAVVECGRRYSGTDYVDAMHRRSRLRGRFLEVFRDVDLLVTPTVATTAFAAGALGTDEIEGRAVDRHLGWSPFSWPMNLAGVPAATLPCGFDSDGLPIGVQIVGPWLGEARILRAVAAFESARSLPAAWPGFAD